MVGRTLEHEVKAGDGRRLLVREAGDPDGFPIFVHHGTPMAGMLFRPWVEDATKRGLRLLSHDRPGYGGSDRQSGRKVAEVAADVVAIADELGIDRFATWGISGGGPHALASAALLPERVTAAAALAPIAPPDAEGLDLVAGMGEENVTEFNLAMKDHEGLRVFLEKGRAEALSASPEGLYETMKTIISDADREVLTGELADFLHETDLVGMADGYDGWFDDDIAFVSPWGFKVEEIGVPILLWQGRQDLMVPFSHGEWLATRIPGVDARFMEEDGHLTLLVTRVADTHEWLKEHSS